MSLSISALVLRLTSLIRGINKPDGIINFLAVNPKVRRASGQADVTFKMLAANLFTRLVAQRLISAPIAKMFHVKHFSNRMLK
jgi:hypothetical protein